MATPAVNAPSISHKETHLLLPDEIIIDETLNGRSEPHSDEDVFERAVNMLTYGQMQPIEIRKDQSEKGRPKLVFGFLRTKAAILINTKFLEEGGPKDKDGNYLKRPDGSEIKVDKPFKLWANIFRGNDTEAFKRNILENLTRKSTSVMDQVINQHRLSTIHNMSDEEIAKLYNTTVQYLQRNRKLMDLPADIQSLIHKGLMPADSGFTLLKLPENQQKEVVADLLAQAKEAEKAKAQRMDSSEQSWLQHKPGANVNHPDFGKPYQPKGTGTGAAAAKLREASATGKKKGGALGAAKVEKAVREKLESSGKADQVGSRKYAAVYDFLQNFDAEGFPRSGRILLRKLAKFKAGTISEKQMENAWVAALREDVAGDQIEDEPETETGGKKGGKKKAA